MSRIQQRSTLTVDYQFHLPRRIAETLANLRDPRMQDRLMKWGPTTVVANRYVVNLHPQDYEDTWLDALGGEVVGQTIDKIAQAIEARANDHYDCFPLSTEPGSRGSIPVRDKIFVEFTRNPGVARGTALLRWDFSQDSDIPETTTGPVATSAPSPPPPTELPRSQFSLELQGGSAAQKVFPLRGHTVLGRVGTDDDPAENRAVILLEHRRVSRRHAELRRVDAGYVLVDPGSTNGTRVNGERLADGIERALQPGDLIEVAGVFRLAFRQDGNDSAPHT